MLNSPGKKRARKWRYNYPKKQLLFGELRTLMPAFPNLPRPNRNKFKTKARTRPFTFE